MKSHTKTSKNLKNLYKSPKKSRKIQFLKTLLLPCSPYSTLFHSPPLLASSSIHITHSPSSSSSHLIPSSSTSSSMLQPPYPTLPLPPHHDVSSLHWLVLFSSFLFHILDARGFSSNKHRRAMSSPPPSLAASTPSSGYSFHLATTSNALLHHHFKLRRCNLLATAHPLDSANNTAHHT